jgi:hypothetical protein
VTVESFISFQGMVDEMREDLRVQYREKVPFACVVALTRTAVICRDKMREHASKSFDRPTPYAINAFMAAPATKKNMASAVYLKPGSGGKNTPAPYFLGPEIDGGARRLKREERALASIGLLNSGAFLAPGGGANINQFGNESTGEIVKIMSVLRAFGEQGYHANRTKGWSKRTRVGQIFVVRAGSNHVGLKPGIYRRGEGGKVTCLQVFVKKAPAYRVRLPFDDLVQADAGRVFPQQLDQAMEKFA